MDCGRDHLTTQQNRWFMTRAAREPHQVTVGNVEVADDQLGNDWRPTLIVDRHRAHPTGTVMTTTVTDGGGGGCSVSSMPCCGTSCRAINRSFAC